ncbi:MAG TPA: suppressor of fused domain protein [Steroidobacteraceae bacterium]|jgi:hypothetical protein
MTLDPKQSSSRRQITAHIERHLGPIKQTFGAASADASDIDVLHVAATVDRPVHTLITAGMSDEPMAVPADADSPRYLELMMTLPREWQLDAQAPREESWYWPIRQLLQVASLPRTSNGWLGWGHTVPNGEPPQPLAANTQLCAAIIVPSLLVPTPFYELVLDERSIAFFSVVPIYKEELALKQSEGMKVLLEKLIDRGIRDLVDPKRKNVAVKRFGFF